MEINHNLINIALVDSKSSGFSTLQKVSEDKAKESKAVEGVSLAKHLAETKQAEESVKRKDANAEELEEAISKVSEQVQNVQRDLIFSIDEESGRDVVTILDSKSREIIKQFPSEELLEIARHLNEQLDTDDKIKAVSLFSSIA